MGKPGLPMILYEERASSCWTNPVISERLLYEVPSLLFDIRKVDMEVTFVRQHKLGNHLKIICSTFPSVVPIVVQTRPPLPPLASTAASPRPRSDSEDMEIVTQQRGRGNLHNSRMVVHFTLFRVCRFDF